MSIESVMLSNQPPQSPFPPSPLAFNLSQHQGFFPMSQLFASDGQRIGASASASVLPMNIQGWFLLGWTGLISLLSKGLSRIFSSSKNWYFGIVVLEKTLKSPLDCKVIKSVNPKGNQSWIFIGRTDAEAEAPILWPPNVKSWLIGKDSDARKDWRRKKAKRVAEDEIG